MSKFFVPSTAHTPADHLRETLDLAELQVSNLRGSGPQVLKLLHLLDQAAQGLAELETTGMDVRAERSRFETIQRRLERRQCHFLVEAGAVLQEERASVQPDRSQRWWFLDEEAARQRQHQLRRLLTRGLLAVLLLAVGSLVYDRFIAPPPQVRQAFQHNSQAEALIEEGDLRAALAEFEMAADLTPDDPSPWLWQGVIHLELNETDDAQVAFDTAQSLYETGLDFLLERSLAYLRVGNLAAASTDAKQAVAQNPQEGQAYYVRASVAAEQGDYATALADLEQATKLARAAGDTQLEATARTQWAMMMQSQSYQQPTPSP
jgi:tetratricopeptide (TPR) repeat protein